MIEDKIQTTRNFIAEQLAATDRPALCCSFGKDSMLMLALVREQKPDIPVLYFQTVAHPTKHAFAEKMIAGWNLNVIRPAPSYRDAIDAGDHIEIIEIHEVARRIFLYLPIEAEPGYTPDADCICGLELAAAPTPAVTALNLTGVFIGHRGDDADSAYGAIPLKDPVHVVNGFRYIYPLKDWTEADIWAASEFLKIPQNHARYGGDMTANNDYYPLCTECLKSEPGSVFCPKMNLLIPRIGAQLNLGERWKFWRSQFVNIEWNASFSPAASSSSSALPPSGGISEM